MRPMWAFLLTELEIIHLCSFFLVHLFILREREREREREKEREREEMSGGASERGERERIPTRLHTVSAEPGVGLEPTSCEIMSSA